MKRFRKLTAVCLMLLCSAAYVAPADHTELCPGVSITGKVEMPDMDREYAAYAARVPKLAQQSDEAIQMICLSLFQSPDAPRTLTRTPEDGGWGAAAEVSNGAETMSLTDDGLAAYSHISINGKYSRVSSAINNMHRANMDMGSLSSRDLQIDLPYLTRQEAAEAMKAALRALNPRMEPLLCWLDGADGERMTALDAAMAQWMGAPQSAEDFTGDPGIYVAQFGFQIDGVAVYGASALDGAGYRTVPSQSMDYAPGIWAGVELSDSGVYSIQASYMEPGDPLETGRPISYETAEAMFISDMSLILLPVPLEVTRVCLQYVLAPGSPAGSLELRPAWCFYTAFAEGEARYPDLVYCYDAITGAVLK